MCFQLLHLLNYQLLKWYIAQHIMTDGRSNIVFIGDVNIPSRRLISSFSASLFRPFPSPFTSFYPSTRFLSSSANMFIFHNIIWKRHATNKYQYRMLENLLKLSLYGFMAYTVVEPYFKQVVTNSNYCRILISHSHRVAWFWQVQVLCHVYGCLQ